MYVNAIITGPTQSMTRRVRSHMARTISSLFTSHLMSSTLFMSTSSQQQQQDPNIDYSSSFLISLDISVSLVSLATLLASCSISSMERAARPHVNFLLLLMLANSRTTNLPV